MSSLKKIVVVTGANKGIGKAIVKLLAQSPPEPPLTVYLCSRDPSRGQGALAEIEANKKGPHEIRLGKLDVLDEASVDAFRSTIEKEHGKLDILIGNAGIAISGDKFDVDVVRDAFAVNYWGNKRTTEAFLPLLKKADSPRIVNVASTAGLSSLIKSDRLRERFTKPDLTIPELETAIKDFEAAVEKGTWKEDGWPSSGYGMSKLSLTALTKILARENPDIVINACCPGYVKTDMAPKGAKTTEQGAATPVQLALDDLGGVTGEFWRDSKVAPW